MRIANGSRECAPDDRLRDMRVPDLSSSSRISLRSSGLRADHIFQIQLSNSDGHASAFSRRDPPEFCIIFHPPRKQRAQGKPGADRTRGSVQKSTGVGPQVQPDQSGFPCAMVYGLLRALPGDRALLSPSPPRSLLLKDLTPASGRQDHTTSPSASALFVNSASASTASHRNVRDDREPPLIRVRRAKISR